MTAAPRRSRFPTRGVFLLAVVLGCWAALRAGTDGAPLDAARVAELVRGAGPWGAAVYLAAFVAGELALVPGIIAIAAAGLVYGPVVGSALAFVGSMLASTTSFAVARRLGLRLPSVRLPKLAERALSHLERHPVSTVAVLRFGFAAYPPLSFALSASSIRTRDYVVGSALGLAFPVGLIATLASRLTA